MIKIRQEIIPLQILSLLPSVLFPLSTPHHNCHYYYYALAKIADFRIISYLLAKSGGKKILTLWGTQIRVLSHLGIRVHTKK